MERENLENKDVSVSFTMSKADKDALTKYLNATPRAGTFSHWFRTAVCSHLISIGVLGEDWRPIGDWGKPKDKPFMRSQSRTGHEPPSKGVKMPAEIATVVFNYVFFGKGHSHQNQSDFYRFVINEAMRLDGIKDKRGNIKPCWAAKSEQHKMEAV